MYSILITEPIAEEAVQAILEKGFGVQYEYAPSPDDNKNDVIAVINRLHGIDGKWMDLYPNLKVIAYHGVGYDAIDLDAAQKRGIHVAITPGQNALAVAEHAIALMIAWSKKLVATASSYPQKGFACKYDYSYSELSGKTLGLIGLGTIGKKVAKIAYNGFDMRVIAYDPFLLNAPEGIELVKNRDEVLSQSDYISVHLNLTPETAKSFGEREFRQMKSTACFINCSRGALVDEEALIKALQNGDIAGAGLDVTDPEECSVDNPLLHMDQVIVTPHIAGSSHEALIRVANMCISNIEEILDHKRPAGLIV